MWRYGPDHGPVAIVALPLFEEANRTRRLAVGILHRLAARGIAGWLPDVPGQGESLAPLGTLATMADAVAALAGRCHAAGRRSYGIGIRSGALLDGGAGHSGRWQLAPQTGAALLKEAHRLWLAAGNAGAQAAMLAGEAPIDIAGNAVPPALLASLADADPDGPPGAARRVVRLTGDPRPADRLVDAPPPWRRSEPGDDVGLAATLADDIAAWIVRCEG